MKNNGATTVVNPCFKKIIRNNSLLKKDRVGNVLVLYDERMLYIGDTCKRIASLELFKSYFKHAAIDINWRNIEYSKVYWPLLKNNPFFRKASNQPWENIDFLSYDLVICLTFEEADLLRLLYKQWLQSQKKLFKTAVFSLSRSTLIKAGWRLKTKFPQHTDLLKFVRSQKGPNQLYLSEKERAWADDWLKANGLSRNEKLLIIIDAASDSKKLLNQAVYNDLLTTLLKTNSVKVLIFDENGIGKQNIYKELVGEEGITKFIFARELDLRKAICLLGSSYTKLIFGPCTGLLHCASGIYNYYVKNGMHISKVPLMVTYTGNYEGRIDNAYMWWGTSPLIQCLMIKDKSGHKELTLLSALSDHDKSNKSDLLGCSEYTTEMIVHFLRKKLKFLNRRSQLSIKLK